LKGGFQVNSGYTVDLFDMGPTSQAPSTSFWSEGHERHREKAFNLSRMAQIAGFALSLAVSSVTAVPDPWLLERRRRDAVVTVSIYRQFVGSFISRSEALRISRQILEWAERERLAVAEYEAARGIQWGVEP
jgi:hypothetical protein